MAHYFTNDEVQSNLKKYSTKILGHTFQFYTDNGVFSKDKLDFGTRLFLENIGVSDIHGDVLDVGCGYGPIGIVVSKTTEANVLMLDVNKRALHLANMNILENDAQNIKTLESECYREIGDAKFDYILTNPPIRAGKKIVYEIVMGAKEHLKKNGTLFIVVRKEQGAKSMINDLMKNYNVSVVTKKNGFFIISCTF